MRTFRVLLAVAVAGLAAVLGTGVAHAQTTTTVATEQEQTSGEQALGADEQKCVDKLLAGGTVDDCPKKPNPILPKLNEVIWGAVFFGVVAVFMMAYAVPRLRGGLAARETKIRDDLRDGERDVAEAEQARSAYRSQIAEARVEAARILDDVRREAGEVRSRLAAEAEADAAAERARTATEIQQATDRALEGLRSQVAQLSFELAERLIGRPVDRQANQPLVERFLDEASRN